MSKIFYIIFLFLIISMNCNCQNNYSKVFNYLNGNEYGIDLQIHDDLIFLHSAGVCDPGTVNSRGCTYFVVISDFYQKLYFYDLFRPASTQLTDVQGDTVFVFGIDYHKVPINYGLIVYKFNFSGDSIGKFINFIKPNTYIEGPSILVKDDFIYLYGNIDNDEGDRSIYLLKLDKSGNILKDERFPDFVHPPKYKLENLARNLVETSDGDLAIISFYYKDDMNYVGVCKFDDEFNIIWQKYLPVFGSADFQNPWPFMEGTKDTGLVVSKEINLRDSMWWFVPNPDKYKGKEVTAVTLTKLDKDGQIAWSDTLFTDVFPGMQSGPYRTIKKTFVCNNGDILCIGDWNCFLCDLRNQAWLARYSNDGKKKWEHIYNNPDYAPTGSGTYFKDAKEAENGDIICTGSIDDVNAWHNDKQYTWLVRLDSLGCYTPGCDVSETLTEIFITANEEIIINISGKIAIYPNPANDMINISVPEGFDAEKAEVFDVLGKRVISLDQEYEDIDVSHLEAGLYFVVVKDKSGRMLSGKFVKGR